MGDMLSGILAGLVAQKMSLESAAQLGVCVYAAAAEGAIAQGQMRGLLASDLFRTLPSCLQ